MPPKKTLLFVNKTSKSKTLTRSDGHERLEIFAHVQKPQRTPAQNTAAEWKNMTTSTFDSLDLSNSSSTDVVHDEPRRDSNSVTRKRRAGRKNADATPDTLTSVMFVETLGVSDFDPFNCLAGRVDCKSAALLKFHFVDVLGVVFPPALAPWKQSLVSFTSSKVISDQSFMFAVLCCVSSTIHYRTSMPAHLQRVLHYRGLAISRLQNSISNMESSPLDAGVLYSVALLLWVDVLQGNMDDVRTHLDGMRSMLKMIQTTTTPGAVVAGVTGFLYSAVAATDTAPIAVPELAERADRLAKQERLFTADCEQFLQSSISATRFFADQNAAVIGESLLNLLAERRKCLMFMAFCSRGGRAPSYEEIEYFIFQNFNIEHQLLALPHNGDEMESLSPMQNAVRLALSLVSQVSVNIGKSNSTFCRAMTAQLVRNMQQTPLLSLWDSSSDLFLWVLAMTASISHGQNEWEWIVPFVSALCSTLRIQSFEQLEEMMTEFFLPPKLAETLPALWDAAQVDSSAMIVEDPVPTAPISSCMMAKQAGFSITEGESIQPISSCLMGEQIDLPIREDPSGRQKSSCLRGRHIDFSVDEARFSVQITPRTISRHACSPKEVRESTGPTSSCMMGRRIDLPVEEDRSAAPVSSCMMGKRVEVR